MILPLEDTGIGAFWLRFATRYTDIELGDVCQETSPSAGEKSEVFPTAMLHRELCPCSYFWRRGYFRGSWVSVVTSDELSVRVTILLKGFVVS